MLDLLREQRYRRHFLREDSRQAGIVMAATGLTYVVSAGNDFMVLRGSPLLAVSLACRGLLLIATAVVVVLLRRARSPRQQDRGLHVALVAAVTLMSVVHLTKLPAGRIQAPLIASGVYITMIYFAQRGPILPRALAGGATTLMGAALIVLGGSHTALEPPARPAGVLALIVLNTVGIFSARSFEEQRRKRFEAERRERIARQELAVKLRELAIEKERAEAMSHARAAFLAAMSHEFRTPMNAVIGLSDLLLDAPLDIEHWGHVRTISDSARALLALLNDILDFAKIDAQKLSLSPAPFDPERLAASVVDMLRPAARARALGLTLDLPPELPELLVGDDARLRQVLVNLVANAVKFTERGAVTLRLAARALEGGEHEIDFHVEDTGIGMTPEVVARLFRPFEQADGGTTRRFGGSGLGLAISRQIVVAMGSDIQVESAPGRGSIFSFALRLAAAPALRRAVAAAPRARDEERPALAILVVDDLAINQQVVSTMLARLGQRADLAGSGEEALHAVAQRDYDVVFMDLHMPGTSGIEATRRLREQLAGRREPVVVAMTASVLDEDRDACRRAGMHDFLGKPLELSELERVLGRVADECAAAGPRPAFESGTRTRAAAARERPRPALAGAEASDIAHELNQPLAASLLNAETALELLGRPTPEVAAARELLREIVTGYERAGTSLRRLRAALQRDAAHADAEPSPRPSPPRDLAESA